MSEITPLRSAKTSGISGKHICIIGRLALQNWLLGECFTREAGASCSQLTSLSDVADLGNEFQADIMLIDCMRTRWHDVILDIDTHNELFKKQRRELPYVALFNVVLGAQIERRAIQSGVTGFFYEKDPLDLFIKGLSLIVQDNLWLPRKVFKNCLGTRPRVDQEGEPGAWVLTGREQEILKMIAKGATNEDIAKSLCISCYTAKSHTHNIFKKIKVPNRLRAALWAGKNL